MGLAKMHTLRSLAPVGLKAMIAMSLALVIGACGSNASSSASGAPAETKAQVAPPSDLRQAGTVALCASLTYPPLDYIVGGKPAGLDPELWDKVAALMGLRKTVLNLNFASMIPGLQAHKCDAIFSALFITKARAQAVDFVPYFQTGQAFVVRKGTAYQPQTAQDLCGHKVAVLQGSFNEILAKGAIAKACKGAGKAIQVRAFPTDPEATIEVQSGRADVLFTAREVAVFRAKQSGTTSLQVASKQILFPVAVGIAVRKGDTQMAEAFKAAIAKLTADGQLRAELDKYGLELASPRTVQASLNS